MPACSRVVSEDASAATCSLPEALEKVAPNRQQALLVGCYHPSATLPACSRKVAHLRLVQLQLFPVLRRSAWDLRAAAAAATREVARLLLRANSGLPPEDPERQSLGLLA